MLNDLEFASCLSIDEGDEDKTSPCEQNEEIRNRCKLLAKILQIKQEGVTLMCIHKHACKIIISLLTPHSIFTHWPLLTPKQYWLKQWLDTEQATGLQLNQWWFNSQTHMSADINGLTFIFSKY